MTNVDVIGASLAVLSIAVYLGLVRLRRVEEKLDALNAALADSAPPGGVTYKGIKS